MQPKKVIANIQITPIGDNKADIHIDTPIWTRVGEDGKIYINLALFGNITTVANNEEDIDASIKEALVCFFKAAQEFGKGIREELTLLGWIVKNQRNIRFKVNRAQRKDRSPVSYNLPNVPTIFDGVMQTGKSKSLSLQV